MSGVAGKCCASQEKRTRKEEKGRTDGRWKKGSRNQRKRAPRVRDQRKYESRQQNAGAAPRLGYLSSSWTDPEVQQLLHQSEPVTPAQRSNC